MKRVLSFVLAAIMCLSLVGCVEIIGDSFDTGDLSSSIPTSNTTQNNSSSYTIDYTDAESFESALNKGKKVKGKVVQFYVNEYAPNSILGVNCHAGEHLNFIFENDLDVKAGDTIVVRITEDPSKIFLIGSWEIPCEFLELIDSADESSSNTSTSNKIAITLSSDDFKNMTYSEAESVLREMGFTNFEYETVTTQNETADNKISSVKFIEFIFVDSDFEVGDIFYADATVKLCYFEYKEPEKPRPVFYSTNDYETAKKGNTGVFSYKNKNGLYDIYWIIDFDAGYIYYFTDGNGENTCDKVKIAAGDLNYRITATWQVGGDQWSWHLHFKYKNYPETLVVNDHNGFATEFTTTNLNDALKVRNTKSIIEY